MKKEEGRRGQRRGGGTRETDHVLLDVITQESTLSQPYKTLRDYHIKYHLRSIFNVIF